MREVVIAGAEDILHPPMLGVIRIRQGSRSPELLASVLNNRPARHLTPQPSRDTRDCPTLRQSEVSLPYQPRLFLICHCY